MVVFERPEMDSEDTLLTSSSRRDVTIDLESFTKEAAMQALRWIQLDIDLEVEVVPPDVLDQFSHAINTVDRNVEKLPSLHTPPSSFSSWSRYFQS